MKRAFLFLLLILSLGSTSWAGEVKMATGKAGGIYAGIVGPELSKQMGSKNPLTMINTGGSRENMELLMKGDVNIAVTQFDVLLANPDMDVMVLGFCYPEYVHMIVNKDSKIDSVKDLSEKTKVAIGNENAGTAVTWAAFCKGDESYKKIPTTQDGGVFALSALQNRQVDAVLLVGGLGVGDAKRADQNAQFKMVSVSDGDFVKAIYKGKKIYEFADVSKSIYPSLLGGRWTDVKTVSCQAVIVCSTKWAQSNQADFEKLYDAVQKAVPNIQLAIKERNAQQK